MTWEYEALAGADRGAVVRHHRWAHACMRLWIGPLDHLVYYPKLAGPVKRRTLAGDASLAGRVRFKRGGTRWTSNRRRRWSRPGRSTLRS